jgi:hypothetical protein
MIDGASASIQTTFPGKRIKGGPVVTASVFLRLDCHIDHIATVLSLVHVEYAAHSIYGRKKWGIPCPNGRALQYRQNGYVT